MARGTWLWFLAVVLTLGTLAYQRMTGPTYPLRGGVTLGGQAIRIKLLRTLGGTGDMPVRVLAADTAIAGSVQWKRYPSADIWDTLALVRHGDTLAAALPHQPPAGKLAYQLRLSRGGEHVVFPAEPAITRFKGDISTFVIIPHLLCMFGGLMLLMRAGIGATAQEPKYRHWATVGVVLFGFGGFLFGPWMQHQAFGPWWAGFPFGTDMTDNKTAVAMLAWLFALWKMRGGKEARGPVIAAALVTLAVFLIPHSVFGSQIDWSQAGPPAGR
jgi:hypothetical protein